jgi:hypothetical protein
MTTSPRSSAFVAPADSRRRAWRTLVELVHTRPTPWLTLVDACNKRQAPWKTLVAICHDPLRRCLALVANRHDPLRRCLALVANRHDPQRRCLALVANRHDPLQRCLALVASVNDPQRRCLALVASVNDPLPWRSRPWPRARGPPAADGRRTPLANKPKPTRRTRTCQNKMTTDRLKSSRIVEHSSPAALAHGARRGPFLLGNPPCPPFLKGGELTPRFASARRLERDWEIPPCPPFSKGGI